MGDLFSGMNTLDAIGILGVCFYLGSYAALQLGVLRGQGYLYPALNIAAAGCVLASLLQAFNLSSAIIQVSWIVISVVGITRMYLVNSRLKFTDLELLFMGDVLAGLPRHRARPLLDTGIWMTAQTGSVLTTEGKPVDHLCYLADGSTDILVNGKHIAKAGAGMVIGDVTYLSGAPATATVTVKEPVKLVRFEADKLRTFLKKNQDIRSILEQNLTDQLRSKLISTSTGAGEDAKAADMKQAVAS